MAVKESGGGRKPSRAEATRKPATKVAKLPVTKVAKLPVTKVANPPATKVANLPATQIANLPATKVAIRPRKVAAKVTQADAEDAVRTLIRWAGDDPEREGLLGTPDRVARAYREFFRGYATDPVSILKRTFEETDGYDEMIVLRDMRFESHCEHHMAPIIGRAHIAYLPRNRVVGISKLARLLDVYAKRLQIQEKLTAQIANTLNDVLQPRGVAVVIDASHQCMTTRGVHKPGTSMVTSRMLGAFRTDPSTRREFLAIIGLPGSTLGSSS